MKRNSDLSVFVITQIGRALLEDCVRVFWIVYARSWKNKDLAENYLFK